MTSLSEIQSFVLKNFSNFGTNKSRETVRLIFEILKKENTRLNSLKIPMKDRDFDNIKSFLLEKRYPQNFHKMQLENVFLPKLSLNKKTEAKIKAFKFLPKNILIEKSISTSPEIKKICERFPKANIQLIESIKEYSKNYTYKFEDYNKRIENLFLIEEKYDFFKPCPCTSSAAGCGYSLLNLGFGCPFECTYCFLQGYQNFPGIIIPANLDEFFNKFTPKFQKGFIFPYARIGTGEFTDSLVFDEITGFSGKIIEFFSGHPEIYFEFKTKSGNIKNILSCRPQKNVVVSWSLNPQNIIRRNEFYTASLSERISAAKEISDAGFGTGFHFDPIIYYEGWEKDYFGVVEELFSKISPENIYWISLGTLRMPKELKISIENRFPANEILDAELLLGRDGKLRYADEIRIDIYRKMIKKIRCFSNKPIIYLCMEPKEVWKKAGLFLKD